jgi:hypothetical protein
MDAPRALPCVRGTALILIRSDTSHPIRSDVSWSDANARWDDSISASDGLPLRYTSVRSPSAQAACIAGASPTAAQTRDETLRNAVELKIQIGNLLAQVSLRCSA